MIRNPYLTLLASLSLSIKTRTSSTLTGPFNSTLRFREGKYINIPNHGSLFIFHEFNANLLNSTSRTSATKHFEDAGVSGETLFDVHYQLKKRGRGWGEPLVGIGCLFFFSFDCWACFGIFWGWGCGRMILLVKKYKMFILGMIRSGGEI